MYKKVTQIDASLFHFQKQPIHIVVPRKERVDRKASSSFQSIFQDTINAQDIQNT